jgi:hypothetical protein
MIALAALVVAAAGARSYARLALPYYAAVDRLMASGHPWEIVSIDVRPGDVSPGSVLMLIGDVRRQSSDAHPAARVVARVQVGEAVETPAVFWTMLLLWPAASARQKLAGFAVGLPIFLGLEAITTAVQLIHSLPTASALLAGLKDPLTLWERWSRFLEAGGRFVIEVCAALLAVTIAQLLQAESFARRSRNALPMTDTELRLMAAAAIIGESSRPNTGNSTPAAIGMPTPL